MRDTIRLPDGTEVPAADYDPDQQPAYTDDGRLITHEMLDEWADELAVESAGAPVDPSTIRIVSTGRGRPSLTGPGHHSPKIQARVPPDLAARTEQRARRDGTSVAAVVRRALEDYLAS